MDNNTTSVENPPRTFTMNRPVRAAAIRARALIAGGVSAADVENRHAVCLEPEEEDHLDNLLVGDEESVESDSSGDEGMVETDDNASSTSQTFFSYGDEDTGPIIHAFNPRRRPGVHVPMLITRLGEPFSRAVDFFMLFFTEEMLYLLRENTNTYAWHHILDTPTYARKSDGAWSECTLQEVKNLLALVIMMGFNPSPDIARFWATCTLYDGGWARRFMSRNRFKSLMAFLHISEPERDDPSDKLSKLQPLLNHIKQVSKDLYQPGEHIAIDERMVKSKARSGLRQYMPMKPVRFGYKIWCCCDSKTGYTLDFNVYTGKRQQPSQYGLAYDVVRTLIEPYELQGYQLYIDNFYTSAHLLTAMHESAVGVCGTTLTTRKQFPEVLKDKQWGRRARRGDARWVRRGVTLYLQWKDTRPVQICSTLHKGHEYRFARRRMKDPNGHYRLIMVRKPSAIDDYNSYMGGVDLADQMIQPYNTLMKCHRWWKTLFFHLIDVAVVNSFIIFKEYARLHSDDRSLQRPAGYSQLSYREELVRNLANITDDETVPQSVNCNKTSCHSAFHTDHTPKHSGRRQNCKLCYATTGQLHRTKWVCKHHMCNVPLCLNVERNCFEEWHSPSTDATRDAVLSSCRFVEP